MEERLGGKRKEKNSIQFQSHEKNNSSNFSLMLKISKEEEYYHRYTSTTRITLSVYEAIANITKMVPRLLVVEFWISTVPALRKFMNLHHLH